ncbi:ABC-F family ATP-binding cassette domain-containing protein [Lachnospira hominis (ex Hitch et al. 2024)]|jgi:ATP-binding cassette subfamily F protein uup|uniref:ABC-F family ATP-binding cassette domain-containing protein n=1 Tax=Lachnospira intestinalis TaxID=3133158 RepID=A0ABV1GKD7_9FIRM
MNILNAEKISKTYGEKVLFDKVVLGVNKGDKIGVIGVNGTGKSTFLKIIAGIEEPDAGEIVSGRGVTVSYLAQAPQFNPGDTIVGYVIKDKNNASEAEAKTILTKLGITDFDAAINTLSGGQRKRIALARTLVSPAEVLILDEPTNHLDSDMVIWLEEYIKKFKGELIMVTHDRYFLDNVTNRIVELDGGKLYGYDTNYSGFLELKTQREEMERATEAKRANILRRELEWIRRGCQARSTKQQARIDRYEDMKEASRQARASFENKALEMNSVSTRLGKKTIELSDICKSFGEKKVIDDFTYIFLRDDRIGIIGKNGCGKSTLMKIITGNLKPDSGSVEIGDTVRIGYFMQENEPLDEKMTVLEFVRSIGEYVTTATGKATASQMCEKFLFGPKSQWTPISKLSGGEKRRLYLLSVLMSAPNVLILDEPTNDLDIETLEILEDYLDGFAGIVIVVSHDRYFLDRTVDRIFSFEGGGRLKQYEGGFSDYYEKKQAENGIASDGAVQSVKEAVSGDTTSAKPKKYYKERENKLKFTYAEQKEYDTIDDDIASLESKIEELDGEIAGAATQYSRLNELMQEKADVEAQLEHKMDRWVYLNDLAEKIEAQKQN